jgi:hypothetical protein
MRCEAFDIRCMWDTVHNSCNIDLGEFQAKRPKGRTKALKALIQHTALQDPALKGLERLVGLLSRNPP